MMTDFYIIDGQETIFDIFNLAEVFPFSSYLE